MKNETLAHSGWMGKSYLYLLLSLSFYVSLLVLNSQLEFSGFNYLTAQCRRFADAMIFAIPILFLYKRRFLFPYIILVNAYLLSNIWYSDSPQTHLIFLVY